MSLGYTGSREPIAEDEGLTVYIYRGEDWNLPRELRGEIETIEDEFSIEKRCFEEPEIRARIHRFPNRKKKTEIKRICHAVERDKHRRRHRRRQALRGGRLSERKGASSLAHPPPSDLPPVSRIPRDERSPEENGFHPIAEVSAAIAAIGPMNVKACYHVHRLAPVRPLMQVAGAHSFYREDHIHRIRRKSAERAHHRALLRPGTASGLEPPMPEAQSYGAV